ncbi:SDR family oxidoreductase [Priestia koreensis]|uniref:SDR family oxidoreductase n=1 Tax=Priestia koreensis TaxID=284581 RepID=UPI00203FCCA1|nr:SDR family NAD(P)-dependent oxidoreductase [Priestia koreensis]MCM3004317.1 SDR family oxidoreductase [Priestia koreensis]
MKKRLANKTAVVTGGASGIGRASALRLAAEGATVAIVDLKESDALPVQQEIQQAGGECLVVEADVSNPESMEKAISSISEKFGAIHIVLSNAGINGAFSPIEELSADEWDQTIQTNLRGTFLTVKNCLPHMKKHGGSIIITSSINGNRTFSNFGMAAYSTSKAGQMAFGKMAALELAQYKIRVNIICPGAIETNIEENTFRNEEKLEEIQIPVEYPEGNQPLKHKSAEPEQVANLVYFLASEESNHITGSEMYIDGAESLL